MVLLNIGRLHFRLTEKRMPPELVVVERRISRRDLFYLLKNCIFKAGEGGLFVGVAHYVTPCGVDSPAPVLCRLPVQLLLEILFYL